MGKLVDQPRQHLATMDASQPSHQQKQQLLVATASSKDGKSLRKYHQRQDTLTLDDLEHFVHSPKDYQSDFYDIQQNTLHLHHKTVASDDLPPHQANTDDFGHSLIPQHVKIESSVQAK